MTSLAARGAALTARMLAPEKHGQGVVKLIRVTPGVVDPDKPWLPVEPTEKTETLKAAVRGVASELIGKEAGSAVILSSDRQVICAPPAIDYQAGDILSVGGERVTVLSVERMPAAGTVSAVKFLVRG